MTQTKQATRSDAAVARRPAAGLPQRIGDWHPVSLAAEGELARVYRARPAGSPPDRPACYAVKVLRERWADDPRAIRLMTSEAVAGRSVSHPHLISILAASLSRQPRHLVMPWLTGATLRAHLDASRPMDLPTVLWIARQVCEALGALHDAGWLHGDVKPGNIFLSSEGHVTLLDLGFARRRDDVGSAVDRCVTGTCQYLAPEWITSAIRPDIRSDLYSLGAVLFETFAGRPPFSGNSLAALAEQHRHAVPPDLRRLVPELPSAVLRLVHQMLAKDPMRRPQTPGEVADRLAELEIATFEWRAFG